MKRRARARASSFPRTNETGGRREEQRGTTARNYQGIQTKEESGFLPCIGPPCSLNLFDAILRNFKSEQFER